MKCNPCFSQIKSYHSFFQVSHLGVASLLICAGMLAMTLPARTAVIADFTGGNGTSLPDQYKGVAGLGWFDAWSSRSGSGGTTTIAVDNTHPMGSGGNYLQLDYARTASGSSNRAGVARTFNKTGTNSINLTTAYTISFDFRVDTLTGFNSSADQFAFSSETTTTIGAFGADAPWALLIRGDTGWVVTNGNGSGGVTSTLNFSTLGLTSIAVNTIYSIEVFVDPIHSGYDLTISDGSNVYRASALNGNQLLGFRTNATAANANVLQFRATNDAIGDEEKWSMDNIAVAAAVPEPQTMALLMGGMMVVILRLQYRRRTRKIQE